MGKRNGARKGKAVAATDSLAADLSDLFKTLPPIKRAELTKTVEKLFQVVHCTFTCTCTYITPQVTSNFTSEPLTPAKQWQEYQEIATLVEKVRRAVSPFHHFTTRHFAISQLNILPFRHSPFHDFTSHQLTTQVREIESGHSMCRTLPDRRNAIKPFVQWLEDLGARVDGVEVGLTLTLTL